MTATPAHLADTLSTGPWQVPDHVVFRLHTLLVSEDVVYLTHDLGPEPSPDMERGLYGVIVAFTPTRVVQLTLNAARSRPTSPARASVDAQSWSRRSLVALSLPPTLEESSANSDFAWDDPVDKAFPYGAAVRLRYDDAVIRVPRSDEASKQDRASLLQLLPSLCSDLASP